MGLFDKWKKKKTTEQEPAYNPILDEAAEAPKPAPQHAKPEAEMPSVHELLEIVHAKTKDAEWNGENGLRFPCGLELIFNIKQTNRFPNGCCVQLLAVMWHPHFDEDMVESIAGFGKTEADAARQGAESFCAGVLVFVLAALNCTGEHTMTTTLQGKKHIFRIPCTIGTQHMGKQDEKAAELWNIVKDSIPQYLGTKKAYWIKLFSSRMGETICEARINGMKFPDLTDVLYQAIADGKSTAEGCSDKCFVLLLQDDATYEPCPFTKADVSQLAFKALDMMKGITDEQSHDRIFGEIRALTPHPFLGGEACAFLPEIYSHIVLNYRASDSVLPVNLNCGEIRKSQIRSFGYLEDAVLQYMRTRKPDKDDNLQILCLSAEFKAVHQAVVNGSKVEDLRFSPLGFMTPEDYVIW